jgi:hypothetical protein
MAHWLWIATLERFEALAWRIWGKRAAERQKMGSEGGRRITLANFRQTGIPLTDIQAENPANQDVRRFWFKYDGQKFHLDCPLTILKNKPDPPELWDAMTDLEVRPGWPLDGTAYDSRAPVG